MPRTAASSTARGGAARGGASSPTAALAAMDARAVLVLDACAEAGIRVPEDLAVMGVDDDPILCESTFPTLSSIRTGRFRMGQRATGMSMTEWRRRNRDAPDE